MIRLTIQQDLHALKQVIDSTGLFPSELLEGMTADFLSNPESSDKWLTKEEGGVPIGVAYYAPERLTEGTYNLYLIAVRTEDQGKGIGAEIMKYVEKKLLREGHRVLIVETSSLPEFEATRNFYKKLDYTQEATIHDFYKQGEHKIIFWKKLI
ncbi:MAG: GNAT family N-acetyltransferase [Bacteroidetes bacterium]|nr:GNAT family N-acetyltransferase [Bacteroidota bacterium]